MALRSQSCDGNSWDLSKENIQPLKFGRSVSNVDSSSANENLLKQQRLNFEEEIRLNNSDDPLEVWYRYIKWTEQNFPSGKDNQLRSLVQKCLNALKDQKQYANDIRWWFVWQKFASLSHNVGSLGVYEFMNSDGICTRLAAFYKQWASELERNEDYAKATEVYKKGLLAEAQPLDDLENAFHEYQSRVSRIVLSQNEESGFVEEPTRNFLGVLKGVGKRATAPVVRQSTIQDVKVSKRTETPTVVSNGGFTVFDEKQSVQQPHYPLSSKEVNLSSIGNDSTKENFRKPDIWTKQKIKQGYLAPSKETGTDFKVYVDQNTPEEPVAKGDFATDALPNVLVSEKKMTTNRSELKEVMAYNEQIVNGGVIEMSFEEARALLYESTKAIKSQKTNRSSVNVKIENAVCNDGFATPTAPSNSMTLTSSSSMPSGSFKPSTTVENQSYTKIKSASTLSVSSFTNGNENRENGSSVFRSNGLQENDKENRFVPVDASGSRSAAAAAVVEVQPIQEQPNKPVPACSAGIVANTSFTCNVIRDAMAVFSNTLPLNGFGNDGTSHLVDNSFSFPAQKDEPSAERLVNNIQSCVSTGSSFKIYDENAEKKSPSSFTTSSDNDNKENIKPFDMIGHVPVKRQTSGILTPATDISIESNEEPVVSANEIRRQSLLATVADVPANGTNLSGLFTQFQLDDPTVAGFMKTLLADRAASTPCHNGSNVAIPSFSSCKPWQIPLNFDNQTSFEADDCSARQNTNLEVVEKSAAKVDQSNVSRVNVENIPSVYNYGATKLSTIVETSREYRSSSCSSSSSGSSTSDGFGSRKRLLSGSTNSTNLQPIYEQFTFAHSTPSSQAASFGRTPQELARERQDDAATPYDNDAPLNKDVGDTKAVRRLYSTDENLDENVDCTGFGRKILITSRINPWDPDVIAQLLMHIPKRLDQFTNFHHFASKLPAVRVGKTIDLGGEVYTVERLIGEGAFAKVYKCKSAEIGDGSSSVVLKIQKPGCPWEFYICEELRRRLTNQNLMSVVGRSIMRIQDSYLFCDGSVLLYDYCLYGTLLDFVNIYKKSNACLSEYFTMYLTVEILRLLESIHSCGFIHTDVKPDNFLFCALEYRNDEIVDLSYSKENFCVRLIDWGRAINMNLLPSGTTFSGKVNTSGFQCCEMLDDRSWTFQTDYYGLLGTVHVLLFGEYMRVYKCSSSGRWKMTSSFKRRWKVDIWRKFFDDLLNVVDCNNLPDLSSYRIQFENCCFAMSEDNGCSLANELANFKQMWIAAN